MPSDFSAVVRKQGDVFSPQMIPEMFALSAQLFADQPPRDVVVTRDHAYGDDERNRLDVHLPSADAKGLPAIVFVHGGGFIQGDKQMPGTPFYDTIGRWAVDAGYAGVTMTYRLAPGFTWPSGAEDVAGAVGWLRANGAEHGIDPDKIVVLGQSAGAAHVASYLAGQGGVAHEAAAAVLLSGIFDLRIGERFPMNNIYYGDDPANDEKQSSIDGVVAAGVPVFLGTAEYDPPVFQAQTHALINAYYERHGRFPAFSYASGHNHITAMLHIGSADTAYGDAIQRFLQEALA